MEELKDYTILTAHQAYVVLREERKKFLKLGNHHASVDLYHVKRRIRKTARSADGTVYYLYGSLYGDDPLVSDPDSLLYRFLSPQMSLNDAEKVAKQCVAGIKSDNFDFGHNVFTYTRDTPKFDARTLAGHQMKPITVESSDDKIMERNLKLNRQAKALFNMHFKSIKEANSLQVGLIQTTWHHCSVDVSDLKSQINTEKHRITIYQTLINDIKKLIGNKPHGMFDITNAKNAFRSDINAEKRDIKHDGQILRRLSKYPGNALIVDYRLAQPVNVETEVPGGNLKTPEQRAHDELHSLQK